MNEQATDFSQFDLYLQQVQEMANHSEFDEVLFAKLEQQTPDKYQAKLAQIYQALNDFEFDKAQLVIAQLNSQNKGETEEHDGQ